VCGKIGLKILHRETPTADSMIRWLSTTMIFVGLVQALAMWSLASRLSKVSLLYGALGGGYWLALLFLGKNPTALLQTMPMAAGIAFVILFFSGCVPCAGITIRQKSVRRFSDLRFGNRHDKSSAAFLEFRFALDDFRGEIPR
jgi:hypothetical protein